MHHTWPCGFGALELRGKDLSLLFGSPVNLSFISLIQRPEGVEEKFLLPDSFVIKMGWAETPCLLRNL